MENENNQQQTPLSQVASMMIDAMRKLENKDIDFKTAQSLAMMGKTVIDAHQAELETVKALKALQVGGLINDHIKYLEPQEPKKIAPKISRKQEDEWLAQDRL